MSDSTLPHNTRIGLLSQQHGWSHDKLIKHKTGMFTVEFHRYMHAHRALGGFRQMIEESDPEIVIHNSGVKENKVGGFFVYWIKFGFSNEPDLNNDTPPELEPEPVFAQDEQPNGDAVHDSILALLNDDDDLWNTAQEALVQSAARVPDDELHGACGDLDREEYEAAEKEREWDNRIAAAEEAEIAEYLTHEQMFGTPPDLAIEEPDEYYERSLPPDYPDVAAPEWAQPYDSDARLGKPSGFRNFKPEGDQPDVVSAANFLMALLRVRLPANVLRWIDYDAKGHPSRIQICETATSGTILERVETALPIVPSFLIAPDVQMGDGDQGVFIDLPAYLDWLLSPDRDPRRLVDTTNADCARLRLNDAGRITYNKEVQSVDVRRLNRKKKAGRPRVYKTARMTNATFQRWQRILDAPGWHVAHEHQTHIYRSFNPGVFKTGEA